MANIGYFGYFTYTNVNPFIMFQIIVSLIDLAYQNVSSILTFFDFRFYPHYNSKTIASDTGNFQILYLSFYIQMSYVTAHMHIK